MEAMVSAGGCCNYTYCILSSYLGDIPLVVSDDFGSVTNVNSAHGLGAVTTYQRLGGNYSDRL